MRNDRIEGVESARVVLPCPDIDPTLAFFTDRLGFVVDAIYPADDPAVVVISGPGLRIELNRKASGSPGVVRLVCRDTDTNGERELVAPNGTRIELVAADPPVVVPPFDASFVVSRNADDAAWGTGRAGMRYRDLIPRRAGGAVIASHIRIPEGGPVPDYVHFHRIRFQMIYCYKGWVRLVYEDQGPPFVLEAGDCVLQPPRIRHRVLECSPGLEVIEIGHPAEHETFADHEMELPTPTLHPEHDFDGQRFVRHEAGKAAWRPFRLEGFTYRDTGIGQATGGIAAAGVARLEGAPSPTPVVHDAPFVFHFVLEGAMTLHAGEGKPSELGPGDAYVLPPGTAYRFSGCSSHLELLEVSLPAEPETKPA